MTYNIHACAFSSRGKVRGNNEDSYYFDGIYPDIGNPGTSQYLKRICNTGQWRCFGVFDGMGGALYGEQASFIASRSLAVTFDAIEDMGEQSPEDVLGQVYVRMNTMVCKRLEQMKASQMGTTAAILLFQGNTVAVSNVGDSRIFRFRDGEGTQLSQDHTDQELLEQLHIKNTKPVLTQYIGMNEDGIVPEPFVKWHQLKNDDYYLICSDGLTDMVSVQQMEQVIDTKRSLKKKTQKLNQLAYEAGAEDNITMILCQVKRRWGI